MMTDNKFVLHEHFSQHHHFDFRLERDGVLSELGGPQRAAGETGERRLAIAVEDHPLSYGNFEGRSRKGSTGLAR